MFDIAGDRLREVPLDLQKLTPGAIAARTKLEEAIDQMMQQPISPTAQIEVDAYGKPIAN